MPDLANGKYVSQADADRQWWPAARDVLIEVAREYGAWITHEDLAQRIQASTRVTTRQPPSEWVGRVLGKVADDAQQRGEPLLTSLCVHADLTIGAGYPGAADDADERTRERVAAEDRLACYRHHGATMPADGGMPTVLPRLTQRPVRARSSSSSRKPPAAPPRPALREATCLNCFMVVPAAPTCRECGSPMPSPSATPEG